MKDGKREAESQTRERADRVVAIGCPLMMPNSRGGGARYLQPIIPAIGDHGWFGVSFKREGEGIYSIGGEARRGNCIIAAPPLSTPPLLPPLHRPCSRAPTGWGT